MLEAAVVVGAMVAPVAAVNTFGLFVYFDCFKIFHVQHNVVPVADMAAAPPGAAY